MLCLVFYFIVNFVEFFFLVFAHLLNKNKKNGLLKKRVWKKKTYYGKPDITKFVHSRLTTYLIPIFFNFLT